MMLLSIVPGERRREALDALNGLATLVQMIDQRAELPAGELAALLALVANSVNGAMRANDDA